MQRLWKTTITAWTLERPRDIKDIISETSYITVFETHLVSHPELQNDGPPPDFLDWEGKPHG